MQNVMFQPEQLMQSKEEPGSFADRQYNPANYLLRLLLLLDFVAFAGSNTTCLVHVSSTLEVVAREQLSWPWHKTLRWLLSVCKRTDLLRSSIAVSLSQQVINELHGCISLSQGRFRSRGVFSFVMPMACGSISLPRSSGAGHDDQHHQQRSLHCWHPSETPMNVGGIANTAPGGRNSPESGGQFCSAMKQLIPMRGGSNLWWGSWIRAHFTTLDTCLG